jgi:hypothetical protein
MLHCGKSTFMMYWELCWKNRPWPTDELKTPATSWRDWRIPQVTCNDIRFPGFENCTPEFLNAAFGVCCYCIYLATLLRVATNEKRDWLWMNCRKYAMTNVRVDSLCLQRSVSRYGTEVYTLTMKTYKVTFFRLRMLSLWHLRVCELTTLEPNDPHTSWDMSSHLAEIQYCAANTNNTPATRILKTAAGNTVLCQDMGWPFIVI